MQFFISSPPPLGIPRDIRTLQVQDLLLGDHENEELQEMYNSLSEVIQLTEELLKDAQEQHASSSGAYGAATSSASAQGATGL